MRPLVATAALSLTACGASAPATVDDPGVGDPSHAILPETLYAVVGEPLILQRDNMVLSQEANGAPYEIAFSGVSGTATASSWSYTPAAAGSVDLLISVAQDGEVLRSASTRIEVSDGIIAPTKLLALGDSLIASGTYLEQLDAVDGVSVDYIGTQLHLGRHDEGYSGRYWCWFARHPDSPLTDASGALDIAAFLAALGDVPDVVLVQLGINYIGTEPLIAMDKAVDLELTCAEEIRAALRAAMPTVIIGYVLTLPGSKNNAFFEADYNPPLDSEWGQRQKFHRIAETMPSRWDGDGSDGLWLLYGNLFIDRTTGYVNAVHPNAQGYAQIDSQIRAWLAAVR